jgi:hypothetical protein
MAADAPAVLSRSIFESAAGKPAGLVDDYSMPDPAKR